jgi:hypothetical protein
VLLFQAMEVVVVVGLELLIASLSQSLDIACLVKDLEKANIISHFKNKVKVEFVDEKFVKMEIFLFHRSR